MLSTDKQTNRQTNAIKNITTFAKEVMKSGDRAVMRAVRSNRSSCSNFACEQTYNLQISSFINLNCFFFINLNCFFSVYDIRITFLSCTALQFIHIFCAYVGLEYAVLYKI